MKPPKLDEPATSQRSAQVFASAAWHSLLWLVIANAIGVMIAVLLLFPRLNDLLGEWTYGRWIMVHMNLELYGWTALPLLGFLFALYGADRGFTAKWCRPILWVWSAALGVGSLSWLSGHCCSLRKLDQRGKQSVGPLWERWQSCSASQCCLRFPFSSISRPVPTVIRP
jgi:cytochrome c oxidase cbb3-type subunit 1